MLNPSIAGTIQSFEDKLQNAGIFTPDEQKLGQDLCDVAKIGASATSYWSLITSGPAIISKFMEIVADVKQLAKDWAGAVPS